MDKLQFLVLITHNSDSPPTPRYATPTTHAPPRNLPFVTQSPSDCGGGGGGGVCQRTPLGARCRPCAVGLRLDPRDNRTCIGRSGGRSVGWDVAAFSAHHAVTGLILYSKLHSVMANAAEYDTDR